MNPYLKQVEQTMPTYNNPYCQPKAYSVSQYPWVRQTPTQPSNDLIWVSGEAEALSYPMAPGSSLVLMDMNNAVMYARQVDGTGKTIVFDTYDLVKRETAPAEPQKEMVSKDELTAMISKIIDEKFANRKKNREEAK